MEYLASLRFAGYRFEKGKQDQRKRDQARNETYRIKLEMALQTHILYHYDCLR